MKSIINIFIIISFTLLSSCSVDIEKTVLESINPVTGEPQDKSGDDPQPEPRAKYFESEPIEGPESSEYMGFGYVNSAHAVASVMGLPRFADIDDIAGESNEHLNKLKVPEVWAHGFSGKGITIAVIDTGVDYNHDDLKQNIAINTGEIPGNGIDDDENGYVDDILGWDFVNDDNNPMDDNGHGTHISGVIAAAKDGYGITGVAYNAKILPIKAIGANGKSHAATVAKAIIYAIQNGADIINLSLGTPDLQYIKDAIQIADDIGILVVYASGNGGETMPAYPAQYAHDIGIAVGSGDPTSVDAFSNMSGDAEIQYVIAPGKNVVSTFLDNQYKVLTGTSMAAPYVSGLAALIMEANGSLSSAEVAAAITSTARHPAELKVLNRSSLSSSSSNIEIMPVAE